MASTACKTAFHSLQNRLPQLAKPPSTACKNAFHSLRKTGFHSLRKTGFHSLRKTGFHSLRKTGFHSLRKPPNPSNDSAENTQTPTAATARFTPQQEACSLPTRPSMRLGSRFIPK